MFSVLQIYIAVGNSLAVQWLGLRAFTAEGVVSIPVWGTKIPQAMRHGQREKKNIYIYIERERERERESEL